MGCILSEEEDDSHFSELDKNKEMQTRNCKIIQVKETADLCRDMQKLSINDSAEKQEKITNHIEIVHGYRREPGKHTRTVTIKNEDSNVGLPPVAESVASFNFPKYFDKNTQKNITLEDQYINDFGSDEHVKQVLRVDEQKDKKVIISWPILEYDESVKCLRLKRKDYFKNYGDLRPTDTSFEIQGLLANYCYIFQLFAVNKKNKERLLFSSEEFKCREKPKQPDGPLEVRELPKSSALISWPSYNNKSDIVKLILSKKSFMDSDKYVMDVTDTQKEIGGLSFRVSYLFSLTAVNEFDDTSTPLQMENVFQLTDVPARPEGPLDVDFLSNCNVKVSWPRYKHENVDNLYLSVIDAPTSSVLDKCKLNVFDTSCILDTLANDKTYVFELVAVNAFQNESRPLRTRESVQLPGTQVPPDGPLELFMYETLREVTIMWPKVRPSKHLKHLKIYKSYCKSSTMKYVCTLPLYTTLYSVKDLDVRHDYMFHLVTVNTIGDESPPLSASTHFTLTVKENNTTTRIDKAGEECRRQRTCHNSTCHRKCEDVEFIMECKHSFCKECETHIKTKKLRANNDSQLFMCPVCKTNDKPQTKESNLVDKSKRNIEIAASNKSDDQEKQNEFKTEEEKSKQKDTQYSHQSKIMIQGIPNIGFTCYANSILQVLGQTPCFVEKLESYVSKLRGNEKCNTMAFMLFDILNSINTSAGFSVSDELVRRLMFKIFSVDKSFERYTQNDCHSFLMCLFNGIKEENNYKETGCNAPIEMFEGEMKNVFKYSTCDHTEFSEAQSFSSLLVPIPNHQNDARKQSETWTVEKGLALLLEKEDFENNILPCTVCEDENRTLVDETVTTKTTEITQAPRNLILQIGRFREHASEYNPHKSTLRKVHSAVGYKKELKVPVKVREETVKKTYKLYAVVLHYGTLNGGHYYSYVKANNSTTKWFYCSDSCVFEVSESDIHRESDQAYLLCYHLNEK